MLFLFVILFYCVLHIFFRPLACSRGNECKITKANVASHKKIIKSLLPVTIASFCFYNSHCFINYVKGEMISLSFSLGIIKFFESSLDMASWL